MKVQPKDLILSSEKLTDFKMSGQGSQLLVNVKRQIHLVDLEHLGEMQNAFQRCHRLAMEEDSQRMSKGCPRIPNISLYFPDGL